MAPEVGVFKRCVVRQHVGCACWVCVLGVRVGCACWTLLLRVKGMLCFVQQDSPTRTCYVCLLQKSPIEETTRTTRVGPLCCVLRGCFAAPPFASASKV